MKWRSLVVGLVAAATAAVPVFARMDVETQVVIPRPIGGYTANPGMGWQYGPGAGRTQLTETVAYRRSSYGWARLNPRPGVYDFGRLDRELDRVQAVGKQLAFRIYTMRGEHHGGHEIPQWVLASGARLLSNGEPDYGSCVYQRRWGAMVEELRRRYDGNPAIAWVDISGYGNFNEWSWQDQTRWEAVPSHPRTVDGMARNRLADMFIGGSGAVTCRGSMAVPSVRRTTTPAGSTPSCSCRRPGSSSRAAMSPCATDTSASDTTASAPRGTRKGCGLRSEISSTRCGAGRPSSTRCAPARRRTADT